MAIQLGRRYIGEKAGVQVLCTKQGDGTLFADDEELAVQQPRALPSSD